MSISTMSIGTMSIGTISISMSVSSVSVSSVSISVSVSIVSVSGASVLGAGNSVDVGGSDSAADVASDIVDVELSMGLLTIDTTVTVARIMKRRVTT